VSDKLQEIKERIDDIGMWGKERKAAQLQTMYDAGEIAWLIEQLEQAQAENDVLVKKIGEMTLVLESETYWASLLEQVNELKAANQKLVEENQRLNRAIDRIGSYCVTELPQVSDFVLKVKRGEDI